MKKKIIVFLLVAVLMMMSICLCACNDDTNTNNDAIVNSLNELNELNDCKFETINKIMTYLNDKRDSNFYSDVDSDRLIDIFEDGIIRIKESNNKDDISSIYFDVTSKIDTIATINPDEIKGRFYSLQEAFDNGYITHNDLEVIAERIRTYGFNTCKDLKEKLEPVIVKDYAELRGKSLEDETVLWYTYGEYNGCIALNLGFNTDGTGTVVYEHMVDGVLFSYPTEADKIIIWRQLPNGKGETDEKR